MKIFTRAGIIFDRAVQALIFFATALLAFAVTSSAQAAPVRIEISGFTSQDGEVLINMFAGPESWQNETPSFVETIKPITANTAVAQYDLPEGQYAFFLFQDLDNSGQLKRTVLGFPDEPYTFSNNVRIQFAKPSWRKISFAVTKDGAVQTVRLVQP